MKNPTLKTVPVYLSGLIVMVATTWLLTPLVGGFHWSLTIFAAVLLCLGAVACHELSERRRGMYITGYFLNAIGSGVAVAALYAQMNWYAEILPLLLALVPAAGLGLVFCLGYFGQKTLWRKIWGICVLLLALVLVVLAVIVWIKWNRVIGSFSFFSGICLLFYMMACLCALDNPNRKWRYLSFSGFWAFAVIAVVVVLILSECDILDGLDFDFGSGSGKKKRRK